MELPSVSTHRNTAIVAPPPVDEPPFVSSRPNRPNAGAASSASHSSTPPNNGRLVSPKEPGPDSMPPETLSPQQPSSAPTARQPVTMDFSQVRNTTWFDRDRARQRKVQELATRRSKPSRAPIASTSQRQLTPVADEVDTFPWDAREEHINELHRRTDGMPLKQPTHLPPSSPPTQSPSPPPVSSPPREKGLPDVSSPVRGEEEFSDHPEAEQAERGNRGGVAFVDDTDVLNEDFDNDEDDGASDNYSDDARQQEKLREQKKTRLARQRKRNQNRSSKHSQPTPKTTLRSAKQPLKRGRKPKNPPVADDPEDEDDNGTPLLDPILDPECPEYELDADAYDTPGPLSNECRRELEAAAYEFETRLHELARKYQKSMGSLLQAAGYGFKTHRKDSTWNDFQAFQTKKNGEKPRPNETVQEFVT
ncbi:hypothetical protein VKT23_016851 [Stygiomarasmius scandens]|uniref:Uncharacterized protein n=1 Tax=Marasmiellus scandens TaxID=2682957 RepID=A0ABR1IW14_9AGAR